ncbi:MAG: hypothetical protein CIT01_03055 [Methanobacterium sp. BRmetb2]|nr:MAG: hypothetical protein CIT01_03055 [Methanobacterium sp. BRmetb2]
MIEWIHVKNFRSLKNFKMNFEEDITIIVGENDCGKTSILESLKIIFNKQKFEEDDISYGEKEAVIEVKIKDRSYIKQVKYEENGLLLENNCVKLSKETINNIKEELDSNTFKELNEEDQRRRLYELMDHLGINKGNMRRIDSLTNKINEKITELESNSYTSSISRIPNDYNLFFLDGKHFQNLDDHIDELYFNQIRQDIWKRDVNGETVEEIINKHLYNSTSDLERQIVDQGSIEKLKTYLPNITEIKIIPQLTQKLNIGVKVQLLEGTEIIPIEKKGDGTKRRITMALLEIRKEIDEEQLHSYIFDEPDTHLHVKAQLDLLNILWGFVRKKKQVIVTSHSPFILNSFSPKNIRLLTLNDYQTELNAVDTDEDIISTLKSLGINNTNLFFSKKILIVEGHTEEKFIPMVFEKIYGFKLQNILVKIIRGNGIDDASKLARVFRDFEFFEESYIYLLLDNDGNRKLKEFNRNLNIPKENKRELGYKEFEDTFDPLIIYIAWKKHVKLNEDAEVYKKFEKKWFYESIKLIRKACIENDLKFSTKLAEYSSDVCCVRMDKVDLGIALANIVEKDDLNPKIVYILEKLVES